MAEGRIGRVAADPLLPLRAFFDLGGSGATADAMAIWIVQWVGQEIRVLDYIEGVGQVLAYYVEELRRRKHDRAICYLPHDGVNANAITGLRYEDHLREPCVSFVRFWPWKFASALRPPPSAGGSPPVSLAPPFGLTLFIEAQASISVPSTEK